MRIDCACLSAKRPEVGKKAGPGLDGDGEEFHALADGFHLELGARYQLAKKVDVLGAGDQDLEGGESHDAEWGTITPAKGEQLFRVSESTLSSASQSRKESMESGELRAY